MASMSHKRKEPDTKTSPEDGVHDPSKKKKQKITKNPFANDVNNIINEATSSDVFSANNKSPRNGYIYRSTRRISTSPKAIVPITRGQQTPLSSSTISHVDSADDTAELVDPVTPPNQTRNGSEIQTPPSISSNGSTSHVDSAGRSLQLLEAESGVSVDLDEGDGEYVLTIKKRSISSSTDENKKEETKQLAQNTGMLFLQAQMLLNMGEQLLAKFRESHLCIFGNSIPRIDLLDQ